MWEFKVRFSSFQDVQDFVSMAAGEKFPILVGNDSFQVAGTSFMGMFSLDHTKPVQITMECSQDEFQGFRQKVERFLCHN